MNPDADGGSARCGPAPTPARWGGMGSRTWNTGTSLQGALVMLRLRVG